MKHGAAAGADTPQNLNASLARRGGRALVSPEEPSRSDHARTIGVPTRMEGDLIGQSISPPKPYDRGTVEIMLLLKDNALTNATRIQAFNLLA